VLADAEPTPSNRAPAAQNARTLPRSAVRPKCMVNLLDRETVFPAAPGGSGACTGVLSTYCRHPTSERYRAVVGDEFSGLAREPDRGAGGAAKSWVGARVGWPRSAVKQQLTVSALGVSRPGRRRRRVWGWRTAPSRRPSSLQAGQTPARTRKTPTRGPKPQHSVPKPAKLQDKVGTFTKANHPSVIVLVDQNRCRGWRFCVSGCPYKKVYFNHRTGKAEKCTRH
jgi:4Fe-4S dicluster domain